MKSLQLMTLGGIVLLLVSGCQHAVHPSLGMQQQFFSSLKNGNSAEEHALRCAQYYNLVGRSDLALNELNLALESSPHNVRLLNAIAGCYDRVQNFVKAREMYEKVLAQDAGNNLVRNNLGYSCYLSGDLTQAEKIFQDILAHQPEDTLARNNLGLVWCRQGKEKEALRLWQKAEGDIQAREKLDQVLAYLGKPSAPSSLNVSQDRAKNRETLLTHVDASKNQADKKPQLTEMTQAAQRLVKSPSSASRTEAQPALDKSSKIVNNQASPSPTPRVRIEEVEMVVQPASYSPAPTAQNVAPQPKSLTSVVPDSMVPGSGSGQTRKPSATEYFIGADLLPKAAEPSAHQRFHRRPQWSRINKPKIITCSPPEPQKTWKPLENYIIQESNFQPSCASGKLEATIY